MTSPNECANETREQIRVVLNRDKVKLWLPPFIAEDGTKRDFPEDLLLKYSNELGLSLDVVSNTMEELRHHAMRKLASDERFRKTGLANIRVKLAGHLPDRVQLPDRPTTSGTASELLVETSLRVSVLDLKHRIAGSSGIGADCLKLIFSGSLLVDGETLENQQVKHNSLIMALCLSASEVDQICVQERASRIEKTREAAELMSSHQDDDDGGYYMQITNQSGMPIDLAKSERKALTLAMVLHEKGRVALKKRNYGEALVFLLEADGEFKKCSATILKLVDNYALVCLDIVWCYLCLKNVTSLPDAEIRLKACEECFNKSYGPNLERLATVKGNTGEEMALLLRLHLLQGVLAYLQRRNSEAKRLLLRAETELKMMKVNEADMMQVMEMGFSEIESRLGLRACGGDIQNAIVHIMQKREEKRQRREQDKQERRNKKLAHKIGKTANGQLVNVEHYNSLVGMGFQKGAVAEALRQSNNDIALSIQLLHERPELLNLPDPDAKTNFEITDDMIAQVAGMGFDLEMARAALHHYGADIERAAVELAQLGGVVPLQWIESLHSSLSATSSMSSVGTAGSTSLDGRTQEQIEREQQLMDEIITDIPKNDEDYLDLTLDEEAELLYEYLTRLAVLDESKTMDQR